MKKIFIVSAILLLIALVFWGIYLVAFKGSSGQKEITAVAPADDQKAESPLFGDKSETVSKAPQPKIYSLTNEAVVSPIIGPDQESIRYYASETGKTYTMSLDGANKQKLSDENLSELVSVLWSPKGDQVISKFKKDGNPAYYYYDFQSAKGTKLKEGIDWIAWSNLGDKIIYKYFDATTKKRTLNIANPDGTGWMKLAEVPFRDILIAQIPQTSLISFWNKPSAVEETKLATVGITGGETTNLFSGKIGSDFLWSPKGDRTLMSFTKEKGGAKISLGVLNSAGTELEDLGIPTLAAKCVWSRTGKTIFYALPGGLTDNLVMPDDYAAGKIMTKDTFWKRDMETGKSERVIELSDIPGEYDATNLFLSPEEDALFFVNRRDQKIYRLDF